MMQWIRAHSSLLTLLAVAGVFFVGVSWLSERLRDEAQLEVVEGENKDLRVKAGIRKEMNEIRNHRGTGADAAQRMRDGTF